MEGAVGAYIARRIWRRPSNSVPVRKEESPLGGNASAGTVQTSETTPNSSPVNLLSEIKRPKREVRGYTVDEIEALLLVFPDWQEDK